MSVKRGPFMRLRRILGSSNQERIQSPFKLSFYNFNCFPYYVRLITNMAIFSLSTLSTLKLLTKTFK